MAEYIEREALLNKIFPIGMPNDGNYGINAKAVKVAIESIPAADVVVLPCKVGDKVYKISRNKVKECEVVFIGLSADKKCSHFNFVENYADGTFYKSYSMVFSVIGKTVFLTREEAERALKGGEG